MKTSVLTINAKELEKAWNETLPRMLNSSDKAVVRADEKVPDAINIHIITAGHSMYSFDFRCKYVDTREVKVELIDVERDHVSTDERTETIQTMIEDYMRHIHECAQQLKGLTDA